jgi:hypothetical protein
MLLDDPLQYRRGAAPVPDALRVHHRNWSIEADPEAVGLRATDEASRALEPEFLKPPFQVLPGLASDLGGAALGLRRLSAEEDMTLETFKTEGGHGERQVGGHGRV